MKVVLLPGLDGTGTLFQPLIKALPKEFDTQVISYPSNRKLSYEQLIELVIEEVPEEEFILVGESFSGYIAYQVALQKPDNLKSIIFVASFLENPKPYLLGLSRWLPTNLILSVPIPSVIAKIFLLGSTASNEMIDLFKQAIKHVSPDVLSFRLEEIRQIPKNHKHCEIRAVYLQADNDNLVPKNCVKKFKEVFENIKVIEMKGSHFLLQVNPLACAKVIANEASY
ncbi:MAG: hypothetical protein GQ547_02120 [Methylophaga sp.]|nr:hypothetical protein [Methylophaga sp.]